MASFPLGVRDDEASKTVWHAVRAFGKRAEQLRDSLKRGDAVELIGYRHTRAIQREGRPPKVIEEVYATVIKPR